MYLSKAKALAQQYSYIRRTRPDGNCFFRAFSYAYLEKLIENKEEYNKFRDLALKSKDSLVALGFPQFTVEDFHDTVRLYIFHKFLILHVLASYQLNIDYKGYNLILMNFSIVHGSHRESRWGHTIQSYGITQVIQ